MKTFSIVSGPPAWRGKTGTLVREDGEFTVLHVIDGKDMHGRALHFDLRLPTACLKAEKTVAQA